MKFIVWSFFKMNSSRMGNLADGSYIQGGAVPPIIPALHSTGASPCSSTGSTTETPANTTTAM